MRRSAIGRYLPECDGGGSASRTGPSRSNRTLNSEFVDIQKSLYLVRQLPERGNPYSVWSCAGEMALSYRQNAIHQVRIPDYLNVSDPIGKMDVDHIAPIHFMFK